MTIICVEDTPIMLQTLKENAEKAYPHADIPAFLSAKFALPSGVKRR